MRAAGGRFLTLWGADDRDRDGRFRVYAAFLDAAGLLVVEHDMHGGAEPLLPSLGEFFPSAVRMERAVFDLLGIRSLEPDHRGWLRHGGWPEDVFPLRRDFDSSAQFGMVSEPYPFVQVEGEGVHEIAVGPVHAGTIEPGHFRFSVVGEKVLRLEQRLGYKHKGIEKRFESLVQKEGHTLAARICGDSAVAYAWAYSAALEAVTGVICPPRGVQLRALALEHERLANHLGDLGALGNDAGFAFGLTQFSRMKEDLLRTNQACFNARYLMDFVVPGGVVSDLPDADPRSVLDRYNLLEHDVVGLRNIYDNHAGVQDRFRGTGTLARETAWELDAAGLAARASGVPHDLRADFPWQPYDKMNVNVSTQASGDVAARVSVRFDEVLESLRICRALLADLQAGDIRRAVPSAGAGLLGIGVIEGWRGPVLIALETGPNGSIRRCHAHDPSWQNWPLIEYAILGNLVPDFPLINKSFNLSYTGHDL
ncbi:NADH-quinone oxidoreductase subunit C [Occallatibacter riparius]|uniref:NADH-quinone oxidoreductase subunit C n=2 Tax=Occallatibacter riparius TaxID=1002689 RepID=A0A9J7BNF3_9BACT|nr:NADH-quinone oxidoreductase subunit C [Occallatibacter riparius]